MSEYSLRHGDFALAGVVVRLSAVGDRISDARCVVFGIAATAERLTFLEEYLNQSTLSEDPTRDIGNIVKQILIENNTHSSESLSDSYCIQYLIPNLFTDGIRAAVANLKISKNL
jgi:CO/xanthine dehydrogenase FAD-binding subunit